jgi:hypothetical protein
MCYMLLLGTNSPENLAKRNTELLVFTKELPGLCEEQSITQPEKWFVGSAHGCSCGFRHLYVGSVDLGFGVPVDWFPEDHEDVEATLQFVQVVESLLVSGFEVECVDAWDNDATSPSLSGTVEVNLKEIGAHAFRFFENHRFVFTGGT